MFWEKKLTQWVQDVRDRANLPARLVLWDGQQHDFGSFAAPQVTLHVKSATALPYLLEPSLDNLGEAYVKGKIDIEGKLSDIINIGYSLGQEHGHEREQAGARAALLQSLEGVGQEGHSVSLRRLERVLQALARQEHGLLVRVLRERRRRPRHRADQEDRPHPHQDPVATGPASARHRLRLGRARAARGAEIRREVRGRDALAEPVRPRHEARERRRARRPDRDSSAGLSRRARPVRPHHERRHVRARRPQEPARLLRQGARTAGRRRHCDEPRHHVERFDSGETALGGGEFIDRYVFPDGELPHIGLALEALQRGGLEAVDVESLRRHYARTLDIWAENFEAKRGAGEALVDDEKFRIWRVYLAGCAYAFENDDVSIYQIVCRKAGRSAKTLPWSRRYMYEKPL